MIARKASTVPWAPLAALGALSASLPPAALVDVTATAASTLFETAPLLLILAAASPLLPPRARTWTGAIAGCGCGRLPGALSLAATALCWFSFGPAIALARWAGAFAIARRHRRAAAEAPAPCALDELPRIAAFALAGAVLTTALRSGYVAGSLAALPAALLFVVGLAAGALTGCTLGSIAFAVGIHVALPAITCGILCTAGLFTAGAGATLHEARRFAGGATTDRRFDYAMIALACLIVAARAGATLVHPKLVPWIALGALLAFGRAVGRTQTRGAAPPGTRLAAVLMLAAALTANASAAGDSAAATIDRLFVGEHLQLVAQLAGTSHRTLVRYAITCCRADAAPVAVRLNRSLPLSIGSWVAVEGTIAADPAGVVLRVTQAHAVAPPPDPFVYR